MVSPPSLNLRKFRGLNLNVDRRFIGEDQLCRAENVEHNTEGLLTSRRATRAAGFGKVDAGVHAAADVGLQRTYILGGSSGGFGSLVLASGGRFNTVTPANNTLYPWTIPLSSLEIGREIAQSSSVIKCGIGRGVFYKDSVGATYFYLPSGVKINGAGVSAAWALPLVATELYLSNLILHKDRLFLTGNWNNVTYARLYFSKEGDPDTWSSPSGGFFDVGIDEGGPMTMASLLDRVVIFKQGSTWVLYTSGGPSNWTLRKIKNIGAHIRTVVEDKGLIYFANSQGVYVTDGNDVRDISGGIKSLFDRTEMINSIGAEDATNSAAIFDDKYLLMLLDADGNKRLFQYDIRSDSWTEFILRQPFISNLNDVGSIERNYNGLSINYTSENGFYLSFKNVFWEGPVIYRFYPDSLEDEFTFYWDEVLNPPVPSTTVFGGSKTPAADALVGTWVRFVSGTLNGEERQITANTTSTITVSPAFDSAPVAGDDYIIVFKDPYEINVGTKAFDLGEPGTFKKLRKSYVTAKVDSMTVTTKADNGDIISEVTVASADTPGDIITAPTAGNVRSTSFSIDIEVPSCEESEFILYGINMYPIPRGELGGTHEGTESID